MSELRRVVTPWEVEGDNMTREEAMGLLSGVAAWVFGYSLNYYA